MKKKRTPDKIKFSLILLIIFLFAVSPADVLQMGDLLIEHDQRDAKIALQLGNNLQENINKFQKSIGQYPKLKTQLVITTSEDDYRNRFRSRKEIMEFSQAFYSPSRKTIFIRNPRDKIKYNRLNRIVFHEYLHHFVFHYFYNAPLWFHEGMAVYFSGDFSQQREINLAIQYFLRNTLSLKEMINYPDKQIEWESFYALSALAVRHMFKENQVQFANLWEKALPLHNFNIAFQQSFGKPVSGFSQDFEKYKKRHFQSMIFIALGSSLWMIFPILFFISLIRSKIRNRKLLRKMEEEEKLAEQEIQIVSEQIEIDE